MSSEPSTPSTLSSRLSGAPLRVPVFALSLGGIIALTAWSLVAPQNAETVLSAVTAWVTEWFGWFYVLLGSVAIIFVLYIGGSRYGKIRLGPDHSRPEFSTFTWVCMLFAAGIGTDIMFYAVLEPASHYLNPPTGQAESIEAARDATVWTIFHYGINGWSMYALLGVAMAYYSYRVGLPLAVRSALYPVFGKRVEGALGHAVDSAAVLGTIFGVATSLGIAVVFLNVGLNQVFGLPVGIASQAGLAAVSVIMAAISATSGVDKGIRILSLLNVILALVLAFWVLITGNTSFLLNAMVTNVGDFTNSFLEKTLETFVYDGASEWMSLWTLFFWAWWIAWACFVGLFLARISRGRTIRQFVVGTMIMPFCYVVMWVSIFGNAALGRIRQGDTKFAEAAQEFTGAGFYELLAGLPLAPVVIILAVLVGLLFFVTSADSGALVMANLCSKLPSPDDDGAGWQRIVWAATTGLLTIAMLIVGGITALQYATIIFGLPFAFVMVLVMFGMLKALRVEGRRVDSGVTALQRMLSARSVTAEPHRPDSWKERLRRATNFVDAAAAGRYLTSTVRPALHEVASELCVLEVNTEVTDELDDSGQPSVVLTTHPVSAEPFVYRVQLAESAVPVFGPRMAGGGDRYARLEVHLNEGGQGYDLMGCTQAQIIDDCLDQYERHLEFLRLGEDIRN